MVIRAAPFLVGFTVACTCLSADESKPFGGATMASLARDRIAAQWVVRRGGEIGVVDEAGNAYMRPNAGLTVPDYPFRLIHIQFPRLSIDQAGEPALDFTDDDLRILDQLESLTSLQIVGTAVTGGFVKYLSGSPKLLKLAIAGENIRANNLSALTTLKSVRELSLSGPMLTENCLEHVAGMEGLELLSYHGTAVDGRGFAALGKLKSLHQLSLQVDDFPLAAVKAIAHLQQVSIVALDARANRGELFLPLATMPGLEKLTLWPVVKDADLANLAVRAAPASAFDSFRAGHRE